MKKHRNHSQLKGQENSPEGANKEADLCSLTDTEFKKGGNENTEGIKMNINSNTDYLKSELETIKRSPEKLENSLVETKAELKALNSRMNNAEE